MRRALGALVLLLAAAQALADWQTRSWSRWEVDGASVRGRFGVDRAELSRLGLPASMHWLLAELEATLVVQGDGAPCTLAEARPALDDATQLQAELRFDCPVAPTAVELHIRTLVARAGSPMHYAALAWRGGTRHDALFTRAADRQAFVWAEARPRTPLGTLVDYLALGFEHILIGADHVAFLLCMLLASPRLGHRLWMVTGFTLGHSITLSLAALGLVQARVAAVEALIGFTVALLAVECFAHAQRTRTAPLALALTLGTCLLAALAGRMPGMPASTLLALALLTPAYLWLGARRRDRTRLHIGMTAVFGLVHGLGFAAVLRALGLPEGQRAWALGGFNLGVELGQIALLLGFAAVLAAVGRFAGVSRAALAERVLAGVLCALGVYWFVERGLAA